MRGTSSNTMPSAAVRQSDSIEISDAARSLATSRKAVTDAPEIRADRVAELKAAIADGTYSVDSRALARSLINKLGSERSARAVLPAVSRGLFWRQAVAASA